MLEESKQVKQLQIQIPPDIKPVFTDNILIVPRFNEYGKIKERDATINILFMNQNAVVSNVHLTLNHAKALVEILKENIMQLEQYEKTGEKPKQDVAKTSQELTYIG